MIDALFSFIFKIVVCSLAFLLFFIIALVLLEIKRAFCAHKFEKRGNIDVCRKCGIIKEDAEGRIRKK